MKNFKKMLSVIVSAIIVVSTCVTINAYENKNDFQIEESASAREMSSTDDEAVPEVSENDSTKKKSLEMYNIFQSIRESRNLDNCTWQYDDETIDFIDLSNSILPIGDNTVSPEWSIHSGSGYNDDICGVHGYIIQDSNDFAERIPDKYMKLVKEVCKWCDTKWYIRKDGIENKKKIDAVHASGNYLANIKYLWTLAPKICYSYAKTVSNSEIDKACDKAFNSLSSAARSRAATIELNNRVREVFKENKSLPSGITNQTQGGRCKYIVFGMLLHLFGDLYAHRLIIPKSALNDITGGTYNSKKTYKSSDVNSKRKDAFINDVKNKKVTFTKAHKKSDNANEYNYLKSSVSKSKYEDNPNFWPYRIDEACLTAYSFLDCYTDGFWKYIAEPCNFDDGLENYDTYFNEVA